MSTTDEECVTICPANIKFVGDNNTCVSSCPTKSFYYDSTSLD